MEHFEYRGIYPNIYDLIELPIIPRPEWQGGSNLSEEYYKAKEEIYGEVETQKSEGLG